MNWEGNVVAQSDPTFTYPKDILGRHCRVVVTYYQVGIFKTKTQAYATDVATNISAFHKGTVSRNGAKKWALEALCHKLHTRAEQIRKAEAAEKERLAKEAELRRIQEEIAAEQRRLVQQLAQQREAQRTQLQNRTNWLRTQLEAKRAEYEQKHRELLALEAQINAEEKDIEEFKVERNEPNTRVIIVMGHTGDGKSTFINRFCGDTSLFGDDKICKVGHNGASCTQTHAKAMVMINGVKYVLVDTPGFADSFGRDREHSNKLCKYVKGCKGLNNFILIRNSTNPRFDKGFQNMLKQYHKMFGDMFFENLIIVATGVDSKINRVKFEKFKQTESMQQDIKTKFELDKDIPVICIGYECYEDSIASLVEIVSDKRVECKDIKSPIDGLKEKRLIMRRDDDILRNEVERIQREISLVNEQINGL